MDRPPHDTEDPRTRRPGICGVTRTTGNVEWVCIAATHAKTYVRHGLDRRGQVIYDQNPSADRHYFVPRYPWRQPSPSRR